MQSRKGLPEEVDELDDLDESGGRLAMDTARDFWLPDAPGLPGNNGAGDSVFQKRRTDTGCRHLVGS
jgi:hypothetical protein